MKNILVATDFSDCSRNAIRYALAIAKQTGAAIKLHHVYEVPLHRHELDVHPEESFFLKGKLEDKLKAIAESESVGSEDFRIEISYEAVEGFTVYEVLKCAQKINAGLIVIGTQGASGIKKILMGSTATSLIAKAECPVLVVPEGAVFEGINRIVFATHFRKIKHKSDLDNLVEIALMFNSEVLIFSARNTEKGIDMINETFDEMDISSILEKVTHSFHVEISENIPKAIDRFAIEKQADMLVTMPQRHSYLELLFNKSVTRELAFHSKIPILCLPEG